MKRQPYTERRAVTVRGRTEWLFDPRDHSGADMAGSYIDDKGVTRFLGLKPRYPQEKPDEL